MNFAKVFAEWYAEVGSSFAMAGIYTDGVVFYLCVTEMHQADLVMKLGARVTGTGRSADGFCGTIVVSSYDWQWSMDIVSSDIEAFSQLYYRDNRLEDAHKIEWFAIQVKESLVARRGE